MYKQNKTGNLTVSLSIEPSLTDITGLLIGSQSMTNTPFPSMRNKLRNLRNKVEYLFLMELASRTYKIGSGCYKIGFQCYKLGSGISVSLDLRGQPYVVAYAHNLKSNEYISVKTQYFDEKSINKTCSLAHLS